MAPEAGRFLRDSMDVAVWLRGLGLEQYAPAFRDNDIDGQILSRLTAEDLRELGIKSIGHRRRLIDAISELGAASADIAVTAASSVVPAQPEAERRQLTVMFCDLVGSTALSARLDPEDLREVIAAYHRAVAEVVTRLDGLISRFMGDGVLVYFGYPQAHEDDAERAVRAGLGAIDAVGRLDFKPAKLQARVGIATGLVVVGDLIGAGPAQEQSVVGETPNLAARLQALAEPDTVIIAAGTRRLVGDLFEYRDLGSVEVKGIAGPVLAWQVLRLSDVESRFEALHGSRLSPLIGRDVEIDLLLRHWARAKAGDGQVVLIAGEAGLGKSRLTAELAERLQSERHLRLRNFCSPYHRDSALFPFVEQLGRRAGFALEDPPAVKLKKLETLLAHAAPQGEDVALIADLLSLPASERHPLRDLSPQRRKQRTLEALLRQLEGLAHRQPVLIVFEDAHWIDPTSRELLDLTVERVRSLPVLLVVTFRPEFQPPWTGQPQVTVLALNRLDRRDQTALIGQIAGGKVLPNEVVDQIIDRTDGVPLFIEELTKSVLEGGLLREEADRYVLDRAVPPFTIPTSLHDSLMARLDRLPIGKEVAQVAAALGRKFTYGLICAITDAMPETLVREALERLVALELVYRKGVPPDAVYTFKHALVQEAAYGSLLRSKRQELHARIASVLEERFADVVQDQPELVASHCTLGGLTEKAIAYWGIAGRKSAARSAMIEAAAQLRKGLDLLPNLPNGLERWSLERDLQSALGAALYASQGPGAPETGQAYMRARKLCEQLDDSTALIPVLSGLWSYHSARSEYQTARQIAGELLEVAQGKNDASSLLVASRSMGTCLFLLGDVAFSRKYFEQVLRLYDADLHRSIASVAAFDPRVAALSYLSWNLLVLGYPDQALSWSEQALVWSRQLCHPPSLGYALTWAAVFNLLRRADQHALRLVQELIALGNERRFPHYVAAANIMRGHLLTVGGETPQGVALVRQGFADLVSTGLNWNQTYFLGLFAQSCGRAEQYDEADALLARALEMADRTGERWFEAELHRLEGELLAARGESHEDQAVTCFRRALEIAKRQSARFWELRTVMNLSSLQSRRGMLAEARALLAEVCGSFSEGFDCIDLRDAKALLSDFS